MIHRTMRQTLIGFLLLSLCFASPLTSRNFNSFESPRKIEQAKEDVERILNKIDPDGFVPIDETLGYRYGWTSRWTSPFNYTVYLGNISESKPVPIIMVEGNAGDVLTFSRIFTIEKIVRNEEDTDLVYEKIYPKYHLIGQTLNLLHPSLGVMYASYGSPSLTGKQTFTRSLTYFVIDGFLVWAAGRNWFQEKFDISTNGGQVAAVMLLTRGSGAYQNQALLRGHNRSVQAGYTFALELY
jgi:hypothetical protein